MNKNVKKYLLTALTISIMSAPVFAGADFDAGMRAYNKGDYSFAKVLFKQAINKNYYDVDSRYMYCQLLMRDKQYDLAKREYETIIKAAPSSNAAALAKQGIANIDAYKAKLAAEAVKKVQTAVNNSNLVKSANNTASTPARPTVATNNASNGTAAANTTKTANAANGTKPQPEAKEYLKNAYTGGKKYVRPSGTTKVYIEQDSKFRPLMIKAYKEWQSAIGSAVMFSFVANKDDATDHISFMKAGGQRQGYCQYNREGDYLVGSTIVINAYDDDGKSKPEELVYTTMLHEIGHSIGIAGHSPYPGDVMYQGARELVPHLSDRDKMTVKMLYRSYGKELKTEDIQKAKQAELEDIAKRLTNSASGLTDLGEEMMAAEKYEKAVEYYTKAATIEPNVDIYYRLIKAYEKLKDQDSVIACYKKILTIKPDDVISANNILHYYERQGRIQEGKDFMEAFLKKNPDLQDPKIDTWKSTFTDKNIKREEIRRRMINAAVDKKESKTKYK